MTSILTVPYKGLRNVRSHEMDVTCDECGQDIPQGNGRLQAVNLSMLKIRQTGVQGKFVHVTHTCAKCRLIDGRLKHHIYTLRTLEEHWKNTKHGTDTPDNHRRNQRL